MKNLKLNKLNRISDELKNAVRGGEQPCCSCGCCYANSGGSSIADNGNANKEHGWHSIYTADCDTALGDQWHIVCPSN
ncbi:MAG: hypothetical protein ACTTKO_04710 [Candidatus Limimorpha sp.]